MRATSVSAAVLSAALAAGCGGGDEAQRVCTAEGGSSACLVDRSGGKVDLEVEGFQPGSEVAVAGLDPNGDQIGKLGKVGGNGRLEDELRYAGSGGQIPEMVVTVQGTSRSGTPVLLTVRRPAS